MSDLRRSCVVYDACVLWPSYLRDFVIRLGIADLVQPKWTDEILVEMSRNLGTKRGIPADAL